MLDVSLFAKGELERICPRYKNLDLIMERCRFFNERLQSTMELVIESIRWILYNSGASEDEIIVEEKRFFISKETETNDDQVIFKKLKAINSQLEFLEAEVLRSFEIKIARTNGSKIHILIIDSKGWDRTLDSQLKYFFYFQQIKILRSHISNGILALMY